VNFKQAVVLAAGEGERELGQEISQNDHRYDRKKVHQQTSDNRDDC